MTIAACFVLPEGVVLASDSTTTSVDGATGKPVVRHFPHGQKIFEVGDSSTLGIVTWGCGGLGEESYRTIIAEFDDSLRTSAPGSLVEVAQAWSTFFWQRYSQAYAPLIASAKQLVAGGKNPEQAEALVRNLSVGFCIGGRWQTSRKPQAFVLEFNPLAPTGPVPVPIGMGALMFWGVPNLVYRLALGVDPDLVKALLLSGKWSGTPQELLGLLQQKALRLPNIMPLRDGIELMHAMIYATCKTLKFSHLPPSCGGPVEIALITTDRPFRWVKHKPFDIALE